LYGNPGDAKLVDERWVDLGGNSGRNRYYFDDGSLFHIYGRSSINLDPQGESQDRADVLLRLYFNDKGNMFEYEKRVNDTRIELEELEMPAIMRRSEALRLLATTDSAGGFDTSAVIAMLHAGDAAMKTAVATEQEPPVGSTVDSAAVSMAVGANDAPPSKQTSADQSKQTSADQSKQRAADQSKQRAANSQTVQTGRQSTSAKTTVAKKPGNASPVQMQSGQKPPPPKTSSAKQPSKQIGKQIADAKSAPAATTPRAATKKQADLVRKPVAPMPDDDGDAVIPVHTHRMIPGPLNSSRVRFQKGSTGVTLSASLEKGRHNEYVLRARRGQTMQVTLDTEQQDVAFRVFLDNSDISGERRNWSGKLPRYGDYHIVVYLNQSSSAQSAGYTVTIGIP
jgi:hypothetical protein